MTNFDPDVLFWALSHAINNNLPDEESMGIRASVKEYLGISGMRINDKVLLDTLKRRLDLSPLDIPPDRKEEIQIVLEKEYGDMFEGLEDLFKL